MSGARTVPAAFPSLFHSSRPAGGEKRSVSPLGPSSAEKNRVPLTLVKLVGNEPPIGLISFTSTVPPAVPSLLHNSIPRLPSSAEKNKVPFTSVKFARLLSVGKLTPG